ncbi:SMC-Scp complex subunit ScpB [Tahibacter sp.]|uniref:SMC-Scp complex subunit ScpB n=1 Tax=Tahibacter sp. TaxID=2056211 RepID=UPI0028C4B673|nr:SMC-Scp complex subunit ScpB [Tahibacter sp.]
MDPQLLKRAIEAILLAAAQPLSLTQLAALFTEEEAVSNEDLISALQALAEDCAERGVELKEVASGYRYQIREDVHHWVTRLWTERPTKYSRALLETLALIAYRQPITRAEIEQIRGVAVSSSIVKTLEEREWIRVVGYRDVPGRPALFGTSRIFLDYFNLKSLDELPPLADIRDLDEYDPQMDLAPVMRPSLELPPEEEDAQPSAAAAEQGETMASDGAATITTVAEPDASAAATGGPVDAIAIETAEPAVSDAGSVVHESAGNAWAEGDDDDTVVDGSESAELPADDDVADRDPPDSDYPDSNPPDPDFPSDDGNVDPTDTTTSDDVPEHTA